MNNQRCELLAPAGDYETLTGALNAGADAVYLGGSKFGARAYASNFSEEELVEGLNYAHLLDKKIYLTLNILVKEKEFGELYDFLRPYYENGLDGIIIQDIGVMDFVHKNFPLLPIHVSTQAYVTGPESVEFFKKLGAVRVVPARELSLDEIKTIKATGIEVETFIHGAMCYSYSGQCLFSSIVGGRSGNRGRCAGPCRLPYSFSYEGKAGFKGEVYPLSLKDMCTIYDIYELLDAGIDSFKIEGRMKKAEYAAGVVSVYRKYIDSYYAGERIKIDPTDDKLLKRLYIRSEIQSGYYHKHNGKDMITLDSPAYSATDDKLLAEIRKEYLTDLKKAKVSMKAFCKVGEPFSLEVIYKDIEVKVLGDTPIEASLTRPATREDVIRSLSKLGNSYFELEGVELDIIGDCFVPVKMLNDLRRQAITALLDKVKDAKLLQRKYRINGNAGC
ncbi:Collagenase-like protease, PrtC family [Lachnospiraceae bacterium G11]|nr:Collagenase-like protease, PrtC family [Lachnospiraceae bacterium G11]